MAKSLKLLTAVFDIHAKKAINTMESMVRPVPKLSDLLWRGLGMPLSGGVRLRVWISRTELKRSFDSTRSAVN